MNGVIYARYSSDSQREESIEGQIRESTEYAKRNGITIMSIEESFFGANSWKILAGIYHGEMSQVAIDLAMKVHLGILGRLTKKYGLA